MRAPRAGGRGAEVVARHRTTSRRRGALPAGAPGGPPEGRRSAPGGLAEAVSKNIHAYIRKNRMRVLRGRVHIYPLVDVVPAGFMLKNRSVALNNDQ